MTGGGWSIKHLFDGQVRDAEMKVPGGVKSNIPPPPPNTSHNCMRRNAWNCEGQGMPTAVVKTNKESHL